MSIEVESQWRVVSVSVAGTSHEKRGQLCQDAHRWQILSEKVLVAAVADGAGSASLGDVGAKIAVDVAVKTIAEQKFLPKDNIGWQYQLIDALRAAKNAVLIESQVRNVAARELAATLILVVATPELVIAAQVGDGAAVVGDGEENIFPVTAPQTGEHINETTFLISETGVENAQVKIWLGKPVYLAMFSDGLQMLALKMPIGLPHSPFFAPLFKFMKVVTNEEEANKQLEEFLRSPKVTGRTDDDLTLLLARYG
ncbi:PP2C family serine/threonine-protein phosphatase [Okeania sp.]|uniref:PP2C family serine/threonine-protein phosphatase n=1 Tax=Okeania sp. TaxID=3100323 RepID=UPI002B4B156B|nr:PP2C family serine/threonine-protein phosphatase [Okeania sp.]MEB3340642.1 PP2C family serine/threonine-protein phosphatase [Okeania sp.]